MAALQHERHAPPPRPPPPQILGLSPQIPTAQAFEEAAHIWSFRDLQKVHDMAYRLVSSGLQADEKGDLHSAAASYSESLRLLDTALRVNCEKLSQCTADHINKAKDIQQKMNKTRQQIAFRLQEIQAQLTETITQQAAVEPSAPPSYEETISMPPNMPPSYENDELTALGESLMRREINNSNLTNGEELFNISDGVQLFYITGDGLVSAPTYPTSLHIVRLMNEAETQGQEATLFLHVGDWMYPLIPGASPVLHTNYGAYLFPDVTATSPGSAVGVMIPDTLTLEVRQRFEDIIRSSTLYGEQSPDLGTSDESPMTSRGVTDKTIQQEFQEGVEQMDMAGKISKGILIVHKLGAITVAMAKEVAPHVKKQGLKILPQSMKNENAQGKSTIDGVVEVAGSGLKGFGTVYMGLEAAAKTLGRCLADETVNIVTHKYGKEAGCLAENTMCTAGNVVMTANNISHLGVKAVAKRAAKETGKALLDDLSDDSPKSPGTPVGSGRNTNSNSYETDKKQLHDSKEKS